MPLIYALLLATAQRFLHPFEPELAGFLWKTKALQPDLFGDVGPDLLVFLVQFGLVLAIVTLDDRDFLGPKGGNPTDNLLVRACFLEIGDQVLHGDAAR